MKNIEEKGKTLDKAFKILKKTYQQIDALNRDFGRLLKELDPSFSFFEEYSYSPNSLYLKEFHIYSYKRINDETDEDYDEHLVGLMILFSDITAKYKVRKNPDYIGPELWSFSLKTKNVNEATRAKDIPYCFSKEERKYFENNKLEIDGQLNNYHYVYKEKDKEITTEWFGKFICYPLTSIENIDSLKTKIVDKLDIIYND